MTMIVGRTRGGTEWTPAFVTELGQAKCIGCGRCYKVCPRDVFTLVDRSLDPEQAFDDDDDFDDDDFSDDTAKVMSLSDPMDCIGCGACYRVCPNQCMSHAPQPV